jgi:hypothetical protein
MGTAVLPQTFNDAEDIKNHEAVIISAPKKCDFCSNRVAKYDFKTQWGPWANGCTVHFLNNGIRLGLGFGQRLIVKEA